MRLGHSKPQILKAPPGLLFVTCEMDSKVKVSGMLCQVSWTFEAYDSLNRSAKAGLVEDDACFMYIYIYINSFCSSQGCQNFQKPLAAAKKRGGPCLACSQKPMLLWMCWFLGGCLFWKFLNFCRHLFPHGLNFKIGTTEKNLRAA